MKDNWYHININIILRIYKCTIFLIQYVVDAPQRKQHLNIYNKYSFYIFIYFHNKTIIVHENNEQAQYNLNI